MENKAGASLKRSYSDFEPFCKWRNDDENEILQIHVKDFKKENLRVQINNRGILTVRGEHPSGGDRWSRFCKEIKVSSDCDHQQIRAKLSGGVLTITMPKKHLPQTETTACVQDPKPQEHAELRQRKDHNKPADESTGKEKCDGGETGQRTLCKLKLNGNCTFKIAGLLLVLLVTYGTYIAYRKIFNKHV